MASLSNGIESWVLMALIHKDIDDFDYKNALALSERLFAIEKDSQDFRFLYAKCQYLLGDYNAAYDVLKDTTSIPCRNLFARSCLELGNLSDKTDKSIFYWRSGIHALQEALADSSKTKAGHKWGDDLTCVALRSHMPSQSTIRNLLGELYIKMDNMRASSQQLLECLAENPFKFTAYTDACDIAPDAGHTDSVLSPNAIFKEFDIETTQLDHSFKSHLPPMPSTCTSKPANRPPKHTTLTTTTSLQQASASQSASALASAYVSTSQQEQDDSPFLIASNTELPRADTPAPSAIITQHDKKPRLEYLMPMIRSSYGDVSLNQLRALVRSSIQTHPAMSSWNDEPERDAIEKNKDEILDLMTADIEKQKAEEAFKNKHGLHKKPPAEVIHGMTMDQKDDNDDKMDTESEVVDPRSNSPPRLDSSSTSDYHGSYSSTGVAPTIKSRLRSKRFSGLTHDTSKKPRPGTPIKTMDNISQQSVASIDNYFVPWLPTSSTTITTNLPDHYQHNQHQHQLHHHHQDPLPSANKRPSLGKTTTGTTTTELTYKATKEVTDQAIIGAMNKIIRISLIIAKGYYYQAHYYCRETALELQKLDNSQYDTPSVLCLMGRAYYDAGDHAGARIFYRRSFSIAPWYCKGVPLYSTCLWYLEMERELSLLAKVMKDNHSHRYEAYISAGNWTKCSNRGNEAARWFQKAVDLDPSRSYGHALLGYEDWEKGNCLGAKQHFAQCMITNKRSYFGWYGSATAYQGMHEFPQARRLIEEAIRLHPRHPVLLGTMAEILLSMKEYELASKYVERSLAIRDNISIQELKKKIDRQLELGDTGESL